MILRAYGFAIALAVGLSLAAFLTADMYNLPLRDPDSLAGPTFVRLPAILAAAFVVDVLPRAVRRAWSTGSIGRELRAVVHERWPLRQVQLVLVGFGSWYVTYVAFRDLKSFVPFVREGINDDALDSFDRVLLLGHDPAQLLHQLLGTGFAAYVLSVVYLAWIVLVPLSLAVAIVWSRDVLRGSWYVTAVAIDWALGLATMYALPTLGPFYTNSAHFDRLPRTWVTSLQETMIAERADAIVNPVATAAVQNIAAFASLHVAILTTACIVAQRSGLRTSLRWTLWAFLAVTTVATVYLGWHFVADVLAGLALGSVAAWLGAVVTGNAHQVGAADRTPADEPVAVRSAS